MTPILDPPDWFPTQPIDAHLPLRVTPPPVPSADRAADAMTSCWIRRLSSGWVRTELRSASPNMSTTREN